MLPRIVVTALLLLVAGACLAQAARSMEKAPGVRLGKGWNQSLGQQWQHEVAIDDGSGRPSFTGIPGGLGNRAEGGKLIVRRRTGSVEQGVPEAQINQALAKLNLAPAQPLPPNLLQPAATASACGASQLQLGKLLKDASYASHISAWEDLFDTFSRATGARIGQLAHNTPHDLLEALRNYSRDCLSDVKQIAPGPLADNLALAVGVLRYNTSQDLPAGGWGTLCSATRLDGDWVLTAKHCFYDSREREARIAPDLGDQIRRGAYKFVLPMLRQELKVTGIACVDDDSQEEACLRYGPRGTRSAGFGSDFVLLKVEPKPGLAVPVLTVSSRGLAAGDAVMLAGWNLFAAVTEASTVAAGNAVGFVDVPSPLRLSRAGTCTVAVVQGVCIVHTCQSSAGTSGAGLLSFTPDGALRVVGVHVAPTDAAEAYMGAQRCNTDAFSTSKLAIASVQRYLGNVGLQLAP